MNRNNHKGQRRDSPERVPGRHHHFLLQVSSSHREAGHLAPPPEHGKEQLKQDPPDLNWEFWGLGKHTWNPEPRG